MHDAEWSGSNTHTDSTTRPCRVVRFIRRDKRDHPSGGPRIHQYGTGRTTDKSGYRHGSGNHNNHNDSRNNSRNNNLQTNDKEVTCYKCGKKGHISPNCLSNGPRIFAAQVVDEEAEAPQESNEQPDRDSSDHDREDPRSGDIKDDNQDPNGSQYDSNQEEDPLDEYEEYVETDDSNSDDGDVVYIRMNHTESSDSEADLAFANTSGVSDISTLLGSADSSMRLMDIPRDMTPDEVLLTLSEDIQKYIWIQRKHEEEPNWTLPTFPIVVEDDEMGIDVPEELANMGYSSYDSIKDAEWLQHLANRDPPEFEELRDTNPQHT